MVNKLIFKDYRRPGTENADKNAGSYRYTNYIVFC